MKCDNPRLVIRAGQKTKKGKVTNEDIEVRCGYCYPCRLTRLRQWIFRLRLEERESKSGYFVTLTYSPKTVPISNNGYLTLRKKDIQNYFKILRNCYRYRDVNPATGKKKWYYDKVPDIKYYAVGEYGTKRTRPHYHAIIFNADEDKIVQAWRQNFESTGDVMLGTVTQQSVAYTLTYIITKSGIDRSNKIDDREKEFSLMSKGIGLSYIKDVRTQQYFKQDINKMHIQLDDKTKIGLPRYYRDKLYTETEIKKRNKWIKEVFIPDLETKDRRSEDQKRNQKIVNSKKIKQNK